MKLWPFARKSITHIADGRALMRRHVGGTSLRDYQRLKAVVMTLHPRRAPASPADPVIVGRLFRR